MNDIELGTRVTHGRKFQLTGKKGYIWMERGDSTKEDFEQNLRDTATAAVEKGLKAEGADALEAVNAEAAAKLIEGGGVLLERLSIAINWAQNFGLVMLFEVAWPEVRQYCGGEMGGLLAEF